MRVLGIETSCDGDWRGHLRHRRGFARPSLHSQIDLHAAYGGVVPELASRDHIRRLPLLLRETLEVTGLLSMGDIDAVATPPAGAGGRCCWSVSVAESAWRGAGCAGAAGASPGGASAVAAAVGRRRRAFRSWRCWFRAATQLMRVAGVGDYVLLGETVDDAAGEAFDKTAKLIGLGYPGGPALAKLARRRPAWALKLPRPMLHSKDFDFSFSGLKTAVLTAAVAPDFTPADQADLAAGVPGGGGGGAGRQGDGGAPPLVACVSWWWPAAWGPTWRCAALDAAAAKRKARVFYPKGAVHRQRRDDRLCRRDAPDGRRAGGTSDGQFMRPAGACRRSPNPGLAAGLSPVGRFGAAGVLFLLPMRLSWPATRRLMLSCGARSSRADITAMAMIQSVPSPSR